MSASRDVTGLHERYVFHMHQVYDWIEALEPEDRDAIITHPDPDYDCGGWHGPTGCGCLVGCVLLHRTEQGSADPLAYTFSERPAAVCGFTHNELHRAHSVGCKVPVLVDALGDAREFWRRVKAFAAAVDRLPEPAPSPVRVQ